MSFENRLPTECELREEINTVNEIGAVDRSFGDPVKVKCRLNAYGRGIRDDLQLGQVIQDNRYTLFLGPNTIITTAHKVTVNGKDYKVDRVREYEDMNGKLHHLECDLQEIR